MRGRQVVWSDEEVQRLAREFVTVAEEVEVIWPEDSSRRERVAGEPGHEFFRRFCEGAPAGVIPPTGTRQGIWVMGPNAEYLGGRFSSGNARDIRAVLSGALERWSTLRSDRGYENLPVPRVSTGSPDAAISSRPMILQVAMRDLPDPTGTLPPPRFETVGSMDEAWGNFLQWAWNETWIGLTRDEAAHWVPLADEAPVPGPVALRLAREVLVDNVRGQGGPWRPEQVKSVHVTARRVGRIAELQTLEYRGEVEMDAGFASLRLNLYGEAEWDEKRSRFERWEMVAVGTRAGGWRFNRREGVPPGTIGFALTLWRARDPSR